MTKDYSLTHGNMFKALLSFSLPYMFANIIQALYGSVDALVVGNFADSAGLSAVATGSMIMMTVNSFVTGFSNGGTVLVGQYTGAEQPEDVKSTIGSLFTLFACVAVGLSVILLFCAKGIAGLMQAPAEAFTYTVQYTSICYIGLLFTSGYNAVSAILRGMGDTKKPLLFIGIACVFNIILDLLFVAGLGLGAAGAAIATTAAQAISFFLSIIYLKRRGFIFDFKLKSFKPDPVKIKSLVRIGLPIGLQDSLANVSFLFMLALINTMGVNTSAAAGVGDKLVTFAMLPPGAFTAAISAMTAQNVGAMQRERAIQGFKLGLGMSLIVGTFLALIMGIFPKWLFGIFTSDAAVIELAPYYLLPYAAEGVLVCFVFSTNGFFNGCGYSQVSMISHLTSTFLVRVPVAWLLGSMEGATLAHVTAAAPISSFIQIIILFYFYKRGKWKRAFELGAK